VLVLTAAGLYAHEAGPEAEAGTVAVGDRCDPGGGSSGAGEAAAPANRIFERLLNEHGYGGGYRVVTDYVQQCRTRSRETFVPLAHPSGYAQVDFGKAVGVIGRVRQKVHFFCMDLPHATDEMPNVAHAFFRPKRSFICFCTA
jgi:hypothetical protein